MFIVRMTLSHFLEQCHQHTVIREPQILPDLGYTKEETNFV